MDYAFEGTSLVTLDAKGRLSLPVRHKDALGGACVVTRHPDGCLLIYPEANWGAVRERLAALPYAGRVLQRIVLGGAERLAPDAHGRILVPSGLRALAGLKKEAILVGLGNRLELWDREAYAKAESGQLAQAPSSVVQEFNF